MSLTWGLARYNVYPELPIRGQHIRASLSRVQQFARTGITFSPNSAPDWLTPKYLNFATAPGHALDPAFDEVVVVGGGFVVVEAGGGVVA